MLKTHSSSHNQPIYRAEPEGPLGRYGSPHISVKQTLCLVRMVRSEVQHNNPSTSVTSHSMAKQDDSIPIGDLLGSELLVKDADNKCSSSSITTLDGKYLGQYLAVSTRDRGYRHGVWLPSDLVWCVVPLRCSDLVLVLVWVRCSDRPPKTRARCQNIPLPGIFPSPVFHYLRDTGIPKNIKYVT